MPLRFLAVPLLLPPLLVLILLAVLGEPDSALAAAAVALAGSAIALALSRESAQRQLEALARKTRSRLEGIPVARTSEETLDEVAALDGAIDSLHARHIAQHAQLTQEARTLTAVLDGMIEGIWVTDAEGTVVRHNDALREKLGPAGDIIETVRGVGYKLSPP